MTCPWLVIFACVHLGQVAPVEQCLPRHAHGVMSKSLGEAPLQLSSDPPISERGLKCGLSAGVQTSSYAMQGLVRLQGREASGWSSDVGVGRANLVPE